MLVLSLFAVFALFLILPVAAAYAAGRSRKGSALFISKDKVHDPRYFAKSFAALMQQAKTDPAASKIRLSRVEELDRITGEGFSQRQYDHLVYCGQSPLTIVPRNMIFQKEVYCTQDICFAGDTVFRSLYTEKNLIIGNGTLIGRWADAEGTAAAYDNCDLGLSFTSASGLCIGNNCTFRRLYAPEILLGCYPCDAFRFGVNNTFETVLSPDAKHVEERNIRYVLDDWKDESGTVPDTLITDQDLTVTENLVVQGHIRSKKGVRLCEGAVVCGNVFAEENIVLGRGSRVLGVVFTQGSVTLEDGATVGYRGKITSLVARDRIFVSGKARVYGYVSCEKGGTVGGAPGSGGAAEPAFSPGRYTFLYLPGGAVPRLCAALSNGRLYHRAADEFNRFPLSVPPQEPQTEPPVTPPNPIPKGVKQAAVLAGICLVCVLAAAAHHLLAPLPEVPGEPPAAGQYHNQGMAQGMQLETAPVEITDDYVVFTDRVLLRFRVPAEEIALDAAVYKSVLDLIPEEVNQYVMLVPLRIFYEQDWRGYAGDMQTAAEQFAALMPQDCTCISLFDALPSGENQYIFYRTEPFWTAEGAYYGAAEFLGVKGETIPALQSYREELYQSFEGSLFKLTGQSKGDDTTYDDRAYFYTQPDFYNQERLYRRQEDGSYRAVLEPVLSKSRTGLSAYVGNYTFSHAIIKGSVKNGKTLLLIGDSSARIMASYFTEAYETVYVINQIWYSQDETVFSEIFQDYSVTDVLMVESMSALGSELNRSRIMRIVNDNIPVRQ